MNDTKRMREVVKRVLITGANSYIGTSFENYVLEHYKDELKITTID